MICKGCDNEAWADGGGRVTIKKTRETYSLCPIRSDFAPCHWSRSKELRVEKLVKDKIIIPRRKS